MQRIVLRRFEKRILQNDSTSPPLQVPATVAVSVFRQGATISVSTTILAATATNVPVYNCGRIAVGDTLQYGAAPTPAFTVTAVDPAGSFITVTSPTTYTVSQGGRFIPTNSPPPVYN